MGRRVAKKRWLPDHVTEYHDRHGKPRYRFRRAGFPTYSFKSSPGTPEFMTEYRACVERVAVPTTARTTPGTFDDLISRYYASPAWRGRMKPSSQATYRNIIERFRAKHGDKPVAKVETRHLDKILGDMADRPAAANNLRKVLKRLFAYAVKIGLRRDNPAAATDSFKAGDGFHTWTEEEIAQFEERWALGTKPRLALALLLYTGQRRSDIIRMGRKDVRDGRIVVTQQKTGNSGAIGMLSELREAIEAMPVIGVETFLITEFGKPFTAAGFGNWFREQCDAAGLTHCTSHGLRKAMSRRLAESGATPAQGRAVTLHKTDREFAYYAQMADQQLLADEALANLPKRVRQNGRKNGDEPTS